MPLLQLIVLAGLAMAGMATLRLVRVHLERTPLPGGRGRLLFLLAFVVVPPLALAALTQPPAGAGALRGVSSLPIYVVIVAILVSLMAVVALIIGLLARNRFGQLARLALTGSEGDPIGVPSNPPVTAKLAESIAIVRGANAMFPRGPEFRAEIDRPGFRADWEALDSATRALEGRIANDCLIGLGAANEATALAKDARGRLDTLRNFAANRGQAWATG